MNSLLKYNNGVRDSALGLVVVSEKNNNYNHFKKIIEKAISESNKFFTKEQKEAF